MTDNTQPGDEQVEDVEGHGIRGNVALPEDPTDEDVEGHGITSGRLYDEDDVEGRRRI